MELDLTENQVKGLIKDIQVPDIGDDGQAIERPARLKLDRLEAAANISDLASLPGNRFEVLKGDRQGQYSIRINDQWRVCFEWPDGAFGPTVVEIVDYH